MISLPELPEGNSVMQIKVNFLLATFVLRFFKESSQSFLKYLFK